MNTKEMSESTPQGNSMEPEFRQRYAHCDACGRIVPQEQVESRVAYGCEGDFCSHCRGVEEEEE